MTFQVTRITEVLGAAFANEAFVRPSVFIHVFSKILFKACSKLSAVNLLECRVLFEDLLVGTSWELTFLRG